MSYCSSFKISSVGLTNLSTEYLLNLFNAQIADEFIICESEQNTIKTQQDIQFRE